MNERVNKSDMCTHVCACAHTDIHSHKHTCTHTAACQISQSVNITSTQGISRVLVVRGDTNVGLLTLITKVILSW